MLVVISGVCAVGFTWDRWWYRVDASHLPGWSETVYKSTNGNILVYRNNDSAVYAYIVDPVHQRIGDAPYSKMYISPYMIFNKESPLPVEWNDKDFELVVEGSRLEFTSQWGRRIQVDLSKY